MKKYEYTKTMLDTYAENNKPVFKFEKGLGYKERIFTSTDTVGETFEFDVFIEKTSDSKYKWQATHAATGLLILSAKTYSECADNVVMKAFDIYKRLTNPVAKPVFDMLRDKINYVPKDTIEKQ